MDIGADHTTLVVLRIINLVAALVEKVRALEARIRVYNPEALTIATVLPVHALAGDHGPHGVLAAGTRTEHADVHRPATDRDRQLRSVYATERSADVTDVAKT